MNDNYYYEISQLRHNFVWKAKYIYCIIYVYNCTLFYIPIIILCNIIFERKIFLIFLC